MTTTDKTTQLRKEHDADLAEARKERNKVVREQDAAKRAKMINQQPIKK